MKNITVSVPDDVYRAARMAAAERGTSVSAIVTAHLRTLSSGGSDVHGLESEQGRIQRQIKRFRAADRLGRDEVHGRDVDVLPSMYHRSLAGSLQSKVARRPANESWEALRRAACETADPDRGG